MAVEESTEEYSGYLITSVEDIKDEPGDGDVIDPDPELSDRDRFMAEAAELQNALRNPQNSEEMLDFVKTEEMVFMSRTPDTTGQDGIPEDPLSLDGNGRVEPESEFILPISISPFKNPGRTSGRSKRRRGTRTYLPMPRSSSSRHTCEVCSCGFRTKRELAAHSKKIHVVNIPQESKPIAVINLEPPTEVLISCKKCSNKFKSKLALDIHECFGSVVSSREEKDKYKPGGRFNRKIEQNQELEDETEGQPEISISFLHRSSRGVPGRVGLRTPSTPQPKKRRTEARQNEDIDIDAIETQTAISLPTTTKKVGRRNSFGSTVPKVNQRKRKPSRSKDSSKSDSDKRLRRSKAKTKLEGFRSIRNHACTECSDTFKRSEHREAHMKTAHPDIKPSLICDECAREFYLSRSLALHKRSHLLEKIHTCFYCDEKFNSKLTLFAHEKTHPVAKAYLCHLCTKEFPTQRQLEKHERQVAHTDEKRFKCPQCPKEFHKKFSYQVHLTTQHKETESILPTHERKYAPRFKCNLCEKSFVSKIQLKDHGNMHTGEKPHKCEDCESSFARKSDLMSHTASIHATIKRYKCEHCGKGFARRAMMEVHIRTHTGEKPCVCDQCGESYHSKRGLLRHQNLYHNEDEPRIKGRHKGIKNFPCANCDKKFVSLEGVRYHEERMHASPSQKPFICPEPKCGKGFLRRYFLDVHVRTHTGERPFDCNIINCGKNFVSKEALATHHRKSHSSSSGSAVYNSEEEEMMAYDELE